MKWAQNALVDRYILHAAAYLGERRRWYRTPTVDLMELERQHWALDPWWRMRADRVVTHTAVQLPEYIEVTLVV